MEVRQNKRLGVMEVWVPAAERGTEETRRQLDAIIAACAGKALVAVYYSGSAELCAATSQLLCSNQRKLVQQSPR